MAQQAGVVMLDLRFPGPALALGEAPGALGARPGLGHPGARRVTERGDRFPYGVGSATPAWALGLSGWEKVPHGQSAVDVKHAQAGASGPSHTLQRSRPRAATRMPHRPRGRTRPAERTPGPWTGDCGRSLHLTETSRCWGPTKASPDGKLASCGPRAGPSPTPLAGLARHPLLLCLLPAHQLLGALG